LVRGSRAAGGFNYLVFFGRLLDPRWQRIIGEDRAAVQFIDPLSSQEDL